MQKAKISVNSELSNKIEQFLNNLDNWRKEQEYLALDELIWKIYSDTGYYNYVSLMPNGMLRQANLRMLFERAKQYETASFKGLYNFIHFIEKIHLSSGDLGAAKIIGENDDVIRIMSIHKSKGLEFPVIFLANVNKQFNKQDIRNDDVLLHQQYGIGAKYINYDMQIQYDTLARQAIKNKIEMENISEEMRILYVALTRAKEKIYITGTVKNVQEKIDKIKKQVEIYKKENGKINKILLKKSMSYLEWILYVYLYNKNRTEKIATVNIISQDEIKNIIKEETEEIQNIDIEETIGIKGYKVQKQLGEKVKNMLEYQYKYILETQLPTKMSVTEIKQKKQMEKMEEIETELPIPQFLKEDINEKITPSERGTIMHLCLQKLDLKRKYDIQEIISFLNELEQKNLITEKEKESIKIEDLYNYTQSEIWKELKEAKIIEREKPFYIQIPAKEIYGEDLDGEILVQGIIDLYYITKDDKLVLLDYKTDYSKSREELINKYKTQLEIYKKALEESLKRKVDKVYIYSLSKWGEILV